MSHATKAIEYKRGIPDDSVLWMIGKHNISNCGFIGSRDKYVNLIRSDVKFVLKLTAGLENRKQYKNSREALNYARSTKGVFSTWYRIRKLKTLLTWKVFTVGRHNFERNSYVSRLWKT